MRPIRAVAFAVLFAAALACDAAAQPLAPLPFRHGEIAVRVNVLRFPDFTARAAADSAAFSGDSLAAARGVAVARAAGIRTGNGLLDGRMRRTLAADAYPAIRFDLLRVVPAATPTRARAPVATQPVPSAGGDTTAVTFHGFFTIRGVTRDVAIPGTVILRPDSIVVATSFPLDIRDYGIAPPTAFFGIVRAKPVVRISVRLVFGEAGKR